MSKQVERAKWCASESSMSDYPLLESPSGELFQLVGATLARTAQIAAMLNRRAAPDEASRAPAPISDEAIEDLRKWLHNFNEAYDPMYQFRAAEMLRDAATRLLAQSQGGQPATSREQGVDHA